MYWWVILSLKFVNPFITTHVFNFLLGGLVFQEEDIIWLKAEAWKSEYEDVVLPKPLDQYKLYTEVSKINKDGSYNIYFTVDEVSMDVFPRFFVDTFLTQTEANEREELNCLINQISGLNLINFKIFSNWYRQRIW